MVLNNLQRMDEQRQDYQQEHIYNSFMPIRDIASKTPQAQWTIETGDERERDRERQRVREICAGSVT